jgi:hypothetical protein
LLDPRPRPVEVAEYVGEAGKRCSGVTAASSGADERQARDGAEVAVPQGLGGSRRPAEVLQRLLRRAFGRDLPADVVAHPLDGGIARSVGIVMSTVQFCGGLDGRPVVEVPQSPAGTVAGDHCEVTRRETEFDRSLPGVEGDWPVPRHTLEVAQRLP